MRASEFETLRIDLIEKINGKLGEYLSGVTNSGLREAMSYSLFAGGKRLRPLLLLAAAGKEADRALPFACAIECIHTYSLIHDDLPAIDNDDLRRGLPTSHKKFGEAMAILAGDGLLNTAFEIMSGHCLINNDKTNLAVMDLITKAAGTNGMISGQVDDIYSNFSKNGKALLDMYARKTGALFRAAVLGGAVFWGASEKELRELSGSADKLGLAFQIKDDLLDITGDEQIIGKRTKSDIKNKKNTYVSVFGQSEAEDSFLMLSGDAIAEFSAFYGAGDFFVWLIKKITKRDK